MTPRSAGDIDWEYVFRRILHGNTGYNTVAAIWKLTIAEIALCLDSDFEAPRAPAGSAPLGMAGPAGQAAFIEWRRSLSNYEKLRLAADAMKGL